MGLSSKSSALTPPLIILGAPRSFTSLVCAMIGQNPMAYGVPELNLFMADTLEEFISELSGGPRQLQIHGLLRTVAQLYAGEQTINSIDMARRWMLVRLDLSTSQVYAQLCKKVAPLRIIDKSPIYSVAVKNLQRIDQAFPDAYYLHLLRHPRSQGESIMRVAKGMMAALADSVDYNTDPPTIDPQIAWYSIQKNIIEFLANIPKDRQLCRRGEDILNDPRAQLAEICGWCRLPADAAAIEEMLHPENSPYACLGPLGAHLGNDPNFLESPELRPSRGFATSLDGALPWRADGKGFERHVISLAREFGYA